MGGGNQKDGDSQEGGIQHLYDTDSRILYNGPWVLDTFTDQDGQTQTSHLTGKNGSTIFASFNGTQIKVVGIVPNGQGPLAANYTVDNGQPIMNSLPIISQSSPLVFQQLFLSPNLTMGIHNITIDVLQTGSDRNYTFQWFTIFSDDDGSDTHGSGHHSHGHGQGNGTNVGAIVGGVLGIVIFLALCLLGAFYFWRRKRLAKMSSDGQRRLPPMMYYARPVSDGTPGEKALYTLEPSVVDTDSRFTFSRHRETVGDPTRSWVSVNSPPSIPRSAVVNDRISDWSSYKGSSVIVEQSHVEQSRFSPYTTTTFSPMAFRDPTPLPAPRRTAGPPSRIETLTTSSGSLGPYEGRAF